MLHKVSTRSCLLSLIFLVLGTGSVFADIDDSPYPTAHQIRLTNIESFPGWRFFVMVQKYDSETGQFLDVERKYIKSSDDYYYFNSATYDWENNKYELGDEVTECGKSHVYAEQNATGKIFVSEETIGAAHYLRPYGEPVDEYKVIAVEEGKVKLRFVGAYMEDYQGERTPIYKGGISDFGVSWFYLALPFACLVSLLLFLFMRKRTGQSQEKTSQ